MFEKTIIKYRDTTLDELRVIFAKHVGKIQRKIKRKLPKYYDNVYLGVGGFDQEDVFIRGHLVRLNGDAVTIDCFVSLFASTETILETIEDHITRLF
jgi:hypothetical protein